MNLMRSLSLLNLSYLVCTTLSRSVFCFSVFGLLFSLLFLPHLDFFRGPNREEFNISESNLVISFFAVPAAQVGGSPHLVMKTYVISNIHAMQKGFEAKAVCLNIISFLLQASLVYPSSSPLHILLLSLFLLLFTSFSDSSALSRGSWAQCCPEPAADLQGTC